VLVYTRIELRSVGGLARKTSFFEFRLLRFRPTNMKLCYKKTPRFRSGFCNWRQGVCCAFIC